MSRKLHFTEEDAREYKQSFTMIAKQKGTGIDVTHELHASVPFMVNVFVGEICNLNKSFNKAPDLLCKNMFWIMIRDKIDESLKGEINE